LEVIQTGKDVNVTVCGEMEEGILEIKEHTLKKHRILRKYLGACNTFHKKYKNFVYIDTHGGSGKVSLKGEIREGSPLISRKTIDSEYPCHIIEIKKDRFQLIEESVKDLPNINVIQGDCNEKIGEILEETKDWKFKLCFVDPDGLVEERIGCPQVSWETIEKISQSPKTEILLNFPLQAMHQCGGYCLARPEDPKSMKYEEDITTFFGMDGWKKVGIHKRKLLNLYLEKRLDSYKYKGAILIRSKEKNAPLYYLIYATHSPVGAKIMRDIMRNEWSPGQTILGDFDELYPLTNFIFEI